MNGYKSKEWNEFNKHMQNNNEELIKQIEEIEEKQGLPKGYIAELLYQKAREGYNAGAALAKVLADTVEEGSNAFDKLATAMVVVCKTAPPDKCGVTIEELVDSLSYINKDQPSPTDITRAHKKISKAVDKIINPTDKTKKAMEKMGIK